MATNRIKPGPRRKMIGKNPNLQQDLSPAEFSKLDDFIQNAAGIDLVQKIGPESSPIYIVEISEEQSKALEESNILSDKFTIEDDTPLDLLRIAESVATDISLLPLGEDRPVKIRVIDQQGRPVANARVFLLGSFLPSEGITGSDGRTTIELFGETPETLQALYVKPGNTNHWSLWIDNPQIVLDEENEVEVRSLSEIYPGFPDTERFGWGEVAMQLDKLGSDKRGAGAKVAVIDSGIDVTHFDLEAMDGRDFREDANDPTSDWQKDEHGHGSHCTGVIAGVSKPQEKKGVIGFAPDATISGLRVFPGGRTSWLIASLQKCIDDEIDVVNLSLGSAEPSELLHQAVIRAKEAGVAMIAAAGNSAGKVMYPAAWPEVLAVAAIGQVGTFPEDSYHTKQIGEHESADGQFFSAKFTCFGDEVDVCAPGVAIPSSVPGNGYAAWDGTSMACPHVTGLAALVLAHRTDVPQTRSAARVEKVYDILRDSASDLGLPTSHQGKGLPVATKALNVTPSQPATGDCAEFEQKLAALQNLLTQAIDVIKTT